MIKPYIARLSDFFMLFNAQKREQISIVAPVETPA